MDGLVNGKSLCELICFATGDPAVIDAFLGDLVGEKLKEVVNYQLKAAFFLTPLMCACWFGYIDLVRFLCDEKGASITLKDEKNRSAIFYAVANGRLDVVKYLLALDEKQLRWYDRFGNTILHIACDSSNFFGVSLLMSIVSPLKILDQAVFFGAAGFSNVQVISTTDVWRCSFAPSSVLLGFLLQSNTFLHDGDLLHLQHADPCEMNSRECFAPLHIACLTGNEDATKYILSKGSAQACCTSHGFTPIHVAIRWNRAHILQLLISADGSSLNVARDMTFQPVGVYWPEATAWSLCCEHSYKCMRIVARFGFGYKMWLDALSICSKHNQIDSLKYLLEFQSWVLGGAAAVRNVRLKKSPENACLLFQFLKWCDIGKDDQELLKLREKFLWREFLRYKIVVEPGSIQANILALCMCHKILKLVCMKARDETQVSDDQIRIAAYYIWKARGGGDDHDHDHWQVAEDELRRSGALSFYKIQTCDMNTIALQMFEVGIPSVEIGSPNMHKLLKVFLEGWSRFVHSYEYFKDRVLLPSPSLDGKLFRCWEGIV
jgi:hypothetical protein